MAYLGNCWIAAVVVAALFASDGLAQSPAEGMAITNSIEMKFVWIKDDAASDRAGYYIGIHEVTQADFKQVLDRNPSVFSASGSLAARVQEVETDRFPVDSVSWHEAVAFCKTLSDLPDEKSSQRRYRLPSSREWELAARAGNAGLWCFGDDRRQLEQYAWFGFDLCQRRPHAVGQKKANAFGLHDVYGNVWEWCGDADPRRATPNSPENTQQQSRIIRGGGWMSEPRRCNSVYRQADPPQVKDSDTGFRVVLELPDKSASN